MRYIDAQFLCTQMQAMRAHAEIVSGAYKFRKVFRGTISGGDKVPLTEDELLQDKMAEMQRHIRFMYDCADTMAEIESSCNNYSAMGRPEGPDGETGHPDRCSTCGVMPHLHRK